VTLVFNASDNYNLGQADQRWVANPGLLLSEAASGLSAVSKGGEQRQCEVPELPCPHIYILMSYGIQWGFLCYMIQQRARRAMKR
jgi:hypothetical protein